MFSPDGEELAFWADSTLKRIAIGGGVPVTISRGGQVPSGGWWGRDGIMFALGGIGIVRVSPDDGKPTTRHPHRQRRRSCRQSADAARRPHGAVHAARRRCLLRQPLGKRAHRRPVARRRRAEDAHRGRERRQVCADRAHRVCAPGYAPRRPVRSRDAPASPAARVPVIEGVRRSAAQVTGAAQFAFSDTGLDGLRARTDSPSRRRSSSTTARASAQALPLPPGSYRYPRVSPDGSQVAFDSSDGKESFVSIYNLSGTAAPPRITFGSNNRYPIWSGDGKHVAFQSDREGAPAVFWQAIGSGSAERLTTAEPGTSHVPESWSRDGVLLYSVRKGAAVSLWSLSIADRQPKAFGDVVSHGLPTNAAFSPDGDWVAYQTADSDSSEGLTYVQPFPATGTKVEIGRGGRPVWSRDGKELFFVPAPVQFRMVKVTTKPSFSFTPPVAVPRPFGISGPGDAANVRSPAGRADHRGRPCRAGSGRRGDARRAQLVRGVEGAGTGEVGGPELEHASARKLRMFLTASLTASGPAGTS